MPLAEGISVIICCYNSAERIVPTLEHLAAQKLDVGVEWEILLVNNASTDCTVNKAKNTWLQLGAVVPLHIIEEPLPGTDHARRAGIYAAKYQYFIFCDDDNWLAPDYISIGYDYIRQHPEIGLLGGQSKAVANITIPDWFETYAGYYAACAPAENSKDMTDWGIWSAGMIGRTVLLKKALDKTVPLINAGRVGNNSSCGEDGEICMRVVLQGKKIYYKKELVLEHYMSDSRLTLDYATTLANNSSNASSIIFSYLRLNRVSKLNYLNKCLLASYHFIKYAFTSMFSRTNDNRFSKDYLYYTTGFRKFESQNNRVIKQFCQMIKGNKVVSN